jgi:chromosome segregation ATPase
MSESDLANQLISWAIGIPSVGVVIAYGISMIRRRVSSDSKSLNEDKSYNDMLETYRRERDEIKTDRDRIIARMSLIERERNEAVGKVGKLTAEVEFLSTQVTELKVLVEKLSVTLDLARAEMQKFAVENAKLAAHVSYLEEVIDRNEQRQKGNHNGE